MSEQQRIKVIKGAYTYLHGNRPYSEENFQVYRDSEDQSLIYVAELLTRVANGEFLKIEIIYHITDKYIPKKVSIMKSLGDKKVQETFISKPKQQTLQYEFHDIGSDTRQGVEIPAPGRYQISTPSAATSLLFALSKKYDSTSINRYNVAIAHNDWDYVAPPEITNVFLHSTNLANQEVRINDKTLMTTKYSVFDNEDHEPDDKSEAIYYLSKYHGIPYKIEAGDDLIIQIRYLNNLEAQDD